MIEAPLDEFIDLWIAGHSSSVKGQRASYRLYAMVEDWWDANRLEPYPLPRVARLRAEQEGGDGGD